MSDSQPASANRAVFLSYASQDAEAARRICESLRSGGVEVWFDADGGLEHGDEWDAKIRRQIKECVFFVPIISASTQARLEGYFRIEWDLAAERSRGVAAGVPFILPIVIDDTREPEALVPDRFRKVQWTQLPGGVVPPDVQARWIKLWSHRVGVLAHDDGRTHSPVYAPPVSSPMAPGETRAPGLAGPVDGATAFGGRRLAAIVFTDVVSYSARMQADEASTLALVQSDFERMRRLCAQHGGQTLKSTGDGLLLCFDSVVDAVTCALAIQSGFAGRGTGALQHRIGVHLGDVYHQGGDVAGDGVNLAARLQTAAQPGTVCVSDAVFAAVNGKVAMESVALAPLALKNIAQPMAAHLIAAVGTRITAGAGARGVSGRRGWVLAAVGVALLAAGVAFFLRRTEKSAALVASRAAPAAEFPHDPDLKRVYRLIYNVVDGIAEDFALADDLVKPLLAARPNDPEVATVAAGLAQEFVTRGFDESPARRAQAQRLTERAVQLAPQNPEALATLGYYLSSNGTQLGRAEESLRRAIELKPLEPRFYCFLYQVLVASKKQAVEIDAFGTRMAELFPDYPMVGFVIASHYTRLGNFAAAEEWLDKSLSLASVPSAITLKAKLMLEVHGDIEGMKRWLDRMPDRQRTNAGLLNAYVVLATVTGQTAPARRLLASNADTWLADGTYIFPKALLVGELDRLDGNDDVARLQFEAALKEVRSKLAADPTDLRPVRAELWVQLGLGRREEARAALRLNLQTRPTPYRWSMRFAWWTSALRACLLLDERAQALALLKEARAEPQGRLLLRNLFRVDPEMAPFRNDPEITAQLAEPKTEISSGTVAPVMNGKPAPADKSVAVLAFANLSDDKGNEYFSDGISEELLTVLQKIPGLHVAARTSAFSFKGRNATAQEIGEKLGVAHLVEGSVQKIGNRVKISARLSRAATGEQLWSKNFPPRELTDAFAAENEIALAIVEELRGRLAGERASSAEVQAQLPAAEIGGTKNLEARQLYLQGKFFSNQLNGESLRRAEELLQRAVDLDPAFAQGWAALAHTAVLTFNYANTLGEFEAANTLAHQASVRAIALEPRLAAAQLARFDVQISDFDWLGAAATLQRASASAPGDSAVIASAATLALFLGQLDKAIELSRQAVALDPVNPAIRVTYGGALAAGRRFGEAAAECRKMVELSPTTPWGHAGVSENLTLQGQFDQAATEAELENPGWSQVYAMALAQWGQKKKTEAGDTLALLVKNYADVAAIQIAQVYAFRGENDRAFEWLERAYRQRDPGLATSKSNPLFDNVRSDLRWPVFLKKIGLSDEQLK